MGRQLVVNSYLAVLFITIFGAIAAMTIIKVAYNSQNAFASTYAASVNDTRAPQAR